MSKKTANKKAPEKANDFRKQPPKQEAKKETEKGSWFSKGDTGFQRKERDDAFREQQREKGVLRFFLGKDKVKGGYQKKTVTFLDDEGFYCNIHKLKKDGKFGKLFVTCTQDYDPPCILSECGNNDYPGGRATYTAHYSVIDHTEYVNREGKTIKATKKLFPASGSAINILREIKKKRGSLVGCQFEVTKHGEKDPSVGTHFEFIKKIDLSKAPDKELVKPFDYMKILAPPTKEDMEMLGLNVSFPIGSSEDLGATEEEGNGDESGDNGVW